MTFGMVPKLMLGGRSVSGPRNPSHSSVTIKVMRKSGCLEARSMERFIIGLMWPLPGNGSATTRRRMDGWELGVVNSMEEI